MRRGEILNIKPEHIKGQTLFIPITKNGHPRTIPLTKRVLYILENSQLPLPMSANAVRLAWDRLKKKGKSKTCISTTYDTRQSHGSLKKGYVFLKFP